MSLCDCRLHVGGPSHVTREGEHAFGCLGVEIERGDSRALVEESTRGGGADTARSARDERHSPREPIWIAHGQQRSLGLGGVSFDPIRDYPLGTRRPDLVTTPGGVPLADVTLDAIRAGTLGATRFARPPRRCACRPRSPSRRGARSSPTTSSGPPSSLPSPTSSCSTSIRHFGRAARRQSSWKHVQPNSRLRRRADGSVRPRSRRGVRGAEAPRGWLAAASHRARRAICTLEQLVSPLPELGLVAANGPNDPEPELVVESGSRHADGRSHGGRLRRHRSLRRRARARPRRRRRRNGPRRSRGRTEARRRERAARRAGAALTRPHSGKARARHRAPRPGRAHARAEEAPRAASPGESGACHEPEREPCAPRRGRGRGSATRLRRAGDDGRCRPVRAAERDRAPRRFADREARRDDAVCRRGATQPRARDPRPRHLRGDALRLRHGARLRRRGRHAVVEGVPRRCLRVPRSQGAFHIGHGIGSADGLRPGDVDALPGGALSRGGTGGGLAGSPERVDLVRRAGPRRSRRNAGHPRGERPRRVARPRGGLGQRRHRIPFGDTQDREAHGPVPPGNGLRDLGLLGHATPRQHLWRRELRRRRPRRVAHDPARLAGGRRDRAGVGGRAAACARAGCARDSGRVLGARPSADLGRGGRALRPPATTRARCPIATALRTSRRPTKCSRVVSRDSTSRSCSTAPGLPMSRKRCSGCSASASLPTISRPRP